jgi:hypothetical protein
MTWIDFYNQKEKIMRTLRSIFIFFALFIAVAGLSQAKTGSPLVIEGKVVADNTGKPVQNVHVYILDGEEEALTNSQGEFRIQSWQKLPFKLTVKSYNNYHATSITITDPSRKQVIRLKSKT